MTELNQITPSNPVLGAAPERESDLRQPARPQSVPTGTSSADIFRVNGVRSGSTGLQTLLSAGAALIRRSLGLETPESDPARGELPRAQIAAMTLTSAFEGGRPDSLQTLDDGIVSYGIHQATLRSGALEAVLREFLDRSNTDTADGLASFLPAIQAKAASLASDKTFLSALRTAAAEPEMLLAQQAVFGTLYFIPSKQKADALGLSSPLSAAIFYDTAIQGGLEAIRARTSADFSNADYTEPEFLKQFLVNRRRYLLDVADIKREQGKSEQAEMLENSIHTRVETFERLLSTGDLELRTVTNEF